MATEQYTKSYPIIDWDKEGNPSFAEEAIVCEHRLTVRVNGVECMTITCTPTDERELVVGRLFTEGFIDAASEIASLEFPTDCVCDVVLCDASRQAQADCTVTDVATTGDACQVRRRFRDRKNRDDYLTVGAYSSWNVADVYALASAFSKDTPLHKKTSGTHSCFLWNGGEVVYVAEDLGRHNTVDKVVGYVLLRGIDPQECKVFISGRVPTDMIVKAIRAKFNVFASKEMPTQEAVSLARKYRATLVCGVRENHMKVFSGMQPLDLVKNPATLTAH